MSIQLAPKAAGPRRPGTLPAARATRPSAPRVLESTRAPAQLSFCFTR